MNKIGLVAGSGQMPVEIIRSCRERDVDVYVVGLQPFADESSFASGGEFADVPHVFARLGEVGKMVGFFRANGVRTVTTAGGIRRPSLREIHPDRMALGILFRILWKFRGGDDGLFRAVFREAERLGLQIVGVEEVVPEMMFGKGVYGLVEPSEADLEDIRVGLVAARELGMTDAGQAVVVQNGVVLAREDRSGTDSLLKRASAVAVTGRKPVMVKIFKPLQDRRVDVPAIGLQTVGMLSRYGIGGIAVEAGGILVIERQAVIAAADEAGIFIIGMEI